jgi:hypothetical protein
MPSVENETLKREEEKTTGKESTPPSKRQIKFRNIPTFTTPTGIHTKKGAPKKRLENHRTEKKGRKQ